MPRLSHCVLLLIVLLPNKSGGNAPESLYNSNNNKRYDNTTHFTNSPRNKSVQTLKEAFRENSIANNPREETSSTSTGREELGEEKDDEFARRKVGINGKGQARANETAMKIFLTPARYKNGVYFTIEPRDNITKNKKNYIRLCCPLGHRLCIKQSKCLVDRDFTFPFAQKMNNGAYALGNVFSPQSLLPCGGTAKHFMIDPITAPGNAYAFLDDATVYFPGKNFFVSSEGYCLAAVNQAGFDLILCGTMLDTSRTYLLVAIIVSLIFLLITFVLYSVLREFRNMHGYTLRAYIASLFISNAIFAVYLHLDTITYSFCALLGFIFNFAMYSTFLWQNVTCFDIWWTFRRFLPVHKPRESRRKKNSRIIKKFIIYSLYAWGVSFVVTILIIIIDFAPNIPDYVVTPEICKYGVWFGTEKAKIIYFYIPIGVTLICNFCLFVWTALKILYDKKRINYQMRESKRRRHDDCNKERLWLYLKLFIVMCINWISLNLTVKLGTSIIDIKSYYVWFVADLITPLQGIIIFIIFVCKKKVLQLLMKRFRWSGESSLCHFRVRRAERLI